MVLEIIGARFLARDFGSSFYVWVSQIGVVLMALAAGYALGGALADRFQKLWFLAVLLVPAGVVTVFIPDWSPSLMNRIVMRHPAEDPIPLLWQKLDPALGSGLVFLLPCLALATMSPYMIRLASRRLTHVGTLSGVIFAASTVGSIAGVFIAGYVLIDHMGITLIFRVTGGIIILTGIACGLLNRWFAAETLTRAGGLL